MGTLKTEQVWIPGSSSGVSLVQRLQAGNRSPLESPPAAKKPLKTDSKLEFLPAPATAVGKENRSILKSPRLVAVIGGANELGGASVGGARTRSWPGSLRRVNFEHNVDVVVYDPVDGDYVCSESQQLNTEPRDRKFIRRVSRGSLAAAQMIGGHQPLDRLQSQSPVPHRPLPPGPQTSNVLSSTNGTLERHQSLQQEPQQQDLDFTFFEDHRGQLRLKFTVPLGPGVAAGDALVKANVAGNKIRVLGTRTVTSSTDSSAASCRRQEISCRYSLPMDVDPYSITARMDSSGNLFVEAPVITGDRRRTIAATEQLGRMIATQ